MDAHTLAAQPSIEWRCMNTNRSINVAASVPGVAHLALMQAGILQGDPFYRYNELEWSWVAQEDWTFEGTFGLNRSAVLLLMPSVLTLTRVDTVANVSVNGVALGSTGNREGECVWGSEGGVSRAVRPTVI